MHETHLIKSHNTGNFSKGHGPRSAASGVGGPTRHQSTCISVNDKSKSSALRHETLEERRGEEMGREVMGTSHT